MDRDLAGRVAVVTGSARNIGRAIALQLAAAGAAVVVSARAAQADAEAVAREITESGGRAVAQVADVTNPSDVERLMSWAVEAFGGLDILVNNAAVRRETPLASLSYEEWREVLGTILDGAFLCVRAALPHLERSEAGAIVNIGGLSAHLGSKDRAHVVAAKAGLVGFTRALAHDLADKGVTANCVVPGLIDTKRGASTRGEPALHRSHATLVGRRGTPDEVAALVRFLCGPEARYLTGQTIHANGGAFLP
jgi:3-oxoacyl-[acyl-carrier protein] reductase